MDANILWLDKIDKNNVEIVGGKNASLGEMIRHLNRALVSVPYGFVTHAQSYKKFLRDNDLANTIYETLNELDIKNIKDLKRTGKKIRYLITHAKFSNSFINDITLSYKKLSEYYTEKDCTVAVRSSATAEDLPNASFAGQQETFLNISGINNLLDAIKKVFASLFTDRAIVYRVQNNFPHNKVLLSVCVQYMVRSDLASSGVMFTIDTETGFNNAIYINAAYGLGETVVQGRVNPDEYIVFKPSVERQQQSILNKKLGSKKIKMVCVDSQTKPTKIKTTDFNERRNFVLTDSEIQQLARLGLIIEKHYKMPMDIEWAKDGKTGKIFIVQARPETGKKENKISIKFLNYELASHGALITKGVSVGRGIGFGNAKILKNISEAGNFTFGDILVTQTTNPDWEPIMKMASAIVTDKGGRTCHAAIVARELGVPAVIGTNNATQKIKDDTKITVSCAQGETGFVYTGISNIKTKKINLKKENKMREKIMLNLALPEEAFSVSALPVAGVGLTRIEFIITNTIGIHPNAILNLNKLKAKFKKRIKNKIYGFNDAKAFYIEKLKFGIATIAAAFYPKPVIIRTSDFKSNEYANLIGGKLFEPLEENPMLGFRGASRYIHKKFKDAFALECKALKEARDNMGLTNIQILIPFVRTLKEAQMVKNILAKNGLVRNKKGLKIIMMCEVPSNVILAEKFLHYFDGFSIGSNDLTQLTLGVDRDSEILAKTFDERDEAMKIFLQQVITTCRKNNKYIGICGQAPSDYPDLARWLIKEGIETISLNTDAALKFL